MIGFKYDDIGPYIDKDPNADLDYGINWAVAGDSWLDGDSISTADWTVDAGLTKHNPVVTGTITTVWLSGGNAGQVYWVSCRIVTSNVIPRTEDRSFRVKVAQR